MELKAQLREGEQGTREVVTRLWLHGSGPVPRGAQEPTRTVVETPSLVSDGGAVGGVLGIGMATVLAPDERDSRSVLACFEPLLQKARHQIPNGVSERDDVRCTLDLASVDPLERALAAAQLGEAIARRLALRTATTPLRVHRLQLSHVRGVRDLDLSFVPGGMTVIAGENGTGKTTILQTVAAFLADLARSGGAKGLPRLLDARDDVLASSDQATATIHCSYEASDQLEKWALTLRRDGASTFDWHRVLFRRDDTPSYVPVFVLYGTNRAVLEIPQRIRTRHAFEPRDAYNGAFGQPRSAPRGASVDFRLFFEWFRGREDLENELRIESAERRDGQLTAVRRAIEGCFEEVSNLRVRRAPQRMQVNKGDVELFVDQLSDGEKCLLALVGDLARRLAMAHPYLDDPLAGAGVVLIDEVELHMHPRWQRRILRSLSATFPGCQFIVTTHSPQVLGEVAPESVRILRVGATGIEQWQPSASLGLDANVVLEDLLGVPARNAATKDRLEELARFIEESRFDAARKLLGQLSVQLGEDHREIVGARWELSIAERVNAED